MDAVPVLDLACASCDLSYEVSVALRHLGFFYVRNHGVSPAAIEAQFEASRRLFALPGAAKRALTFNVTLDIGYTGGSGVAQALDTTATESWRARPTPRKASCSRTTRCSSPATRR